MNGNRMNQIDTKITCPYCLYRYTVHSPLCPGNNNNGRIDREALEMLGTLRELGVDIHAYNLFSPYADCITQPHDPSEPSKGGDN